MAEVVLRIETLHDVPSASTREGHVLLQHARPLHQHIGSGTIVLCTPAASRSEGVQSRSVQEATRILEHAGGTGLAEKRSP